ncbi:hypothetical protein CDL15_Pgr004725 [Punica granatum]|uniref:Uncharacterized protein n=1 Tax=Punica granatum TaxID=22663 RepID=A0A218W6S8_PUNGR|nr:hypothetical protein CDL15_Pgr004725 [Punica granatum]
MARQARLRGAEHSRTSATSGSITHQNQRDFELSRTNKHSRRATHQNQNEEAEPGAAVGLLSEKQPPESLRLLEEEH